MGAEEETLPFSDWTKEELADYIEKVEARYTVVVKQRDELLAAVKAHAEDIDISRDCCPADVPPCPTCIMLDVVARLEGE